MAQNNPNLGTPTIIIPADDSVRVNVTGTFANCIKATRADSGAIDGELTVQLGNAANKIRFNQGDKPRAKDGETFDHITLNNDTASVITVVLGYGDGDIETAQQVTISGTAQVSDGTTQGKLDTLHTDNGTTQGKLDTLHTDVAAVTSMLQNDTDQRSALTDLTGATYTEAAGATTTALSAAANTGGAIIRFGGVWAAAATSAQILVDDKILIGCGYTSGSSSAIDSGSVRDIYVPTGKSIKVATNNTTASKAWVWVEAL